MPALRELQIRFRDGVLAGEGAEDRLAECLVESGQTGRDRIAAYRRSILGNLVGALLATYPVLARIVGLPFFRAAGRDYIRERPSISGDLNDYGDAFAEFIAAWPPGRELGYLPDVARLEWQVQQVYYAPEATTDLSALAACAPEDYGALRFRVAPALARIDSAWPLTDIWRVNADGYEGSMAVDFARGARLTVVRRHGLVHVEALTRGEAAFLDAIAAGRRLETAAASALAADAGFELGAVLARMVAIGAIVAAVLPATGRKGQP